MAHLRNELLRLGFRRWRGAASGLGNLAGGISGEVVPDLRQSHPVGSGRGRRRRTGVLPAWPESYSLGAYPLSEELCVTPLDDCPFLLRPPQLLVDQAALYVGTYDVFLHTPD